MKIFRKAFVPTQAAWAAIIVILILVVVFYIISSFLLNTQAEIFSWS